MSTPDQKGVIVELVGIPIVVRKPAGEARGNPCKAPADADVGRIASQHHAQRRVVGGGIDRRDNLVVNHGVPIETKPRAIDQARGENVAVFEGRDVARGLRQDIHVI